MGTYEREESDHFTEAGKGHPAGSGFVNAIVS